MVVLKYSFFDRKHTEKCENDFFDTRKEKAKFRNSFAAVATTASDRQIQTELGIDERVLLAWRLRRQDRRRRGLKEEQGGQGPPRGSEGEIII